MLGELRKTVDDSCMLKHGAASSSTREGDLEIRHTTDLDGMELPSCRMLDTSSRPGKHDLLKASRGEDVTPDENVPCISKMATLLYTCLTRVRLNAAWEDVQRRQDSWSAWLAISGLSQSFVGADQCRESLPSA